MNSDYTAIKNYEVLVKFLGKWPSFDDFEVVSMLLKRSDEGELWPTLVTEFVGFRQDVPMESPDRSNCLIVLRFGGLENMSLNGFNHQNAINGLAVKANWSDRRKRDLFTVDLVQGFGVGTKFECVEIEVVSVTQTILG